MSEHQENDCCCCCTFFLIVLRVSCVAFTFSGSPDPCSSSSSSCLDSGGHGSNSSNRKNSSRHPLYLCAGYEDGSARCWECHTGLCISTCKAVRPAKPFSSGSSRGKRDRLLELTAAVAPKW
jgi:WD40 repeat protein